MGGRPSYINLSLSSQLSANRCVHTTHGDVREFHSIDRRTDRNESTGVGVASASAAHVRPNPSAPSSPTFHHADHRLRRRTRLRRRVVRRARGVQDRRPAGRLWLLRTRAVHPPSSALVVSVQSGTGVVREGDTEHRVEPGDVVTVAADQDRGIRADDDSRLEALLVTAPPPTDAEHEPVREGLRTGAFEPY